MNDPAMRQVKPCPKECDDDTHDLYVLDRKESPVLVGLPHDVQPDRQGFVKITLT